MPLPLVATCPWKAAPPEPSILAVSGIGGVGPTLPANACTPQCKLFAQTRDETGQITGGNCVLAFGAIAAMNLDRTMREIAAALIPQEKMLAQPPVSPPPQ